jgi:hypothetical protein
MFVGAEKNALVILRKRAFSVLRLTIKGADEKGGFEPCQVLTWAF